MVDTHIVDVRSAHGLDDVLRGIDVVVHLAAKVGLGVDVQDMPDYASVNVTGPPICWPRCTAYPSSAWCWRARWSCTERARTTARSTDEYGRQRAPRTTCAPGGSSRAARVVGARSAWTTVDEDAPLDPRSTYAATKLAQEHLAAAWASATGGRVAALRFHNVYGPRMPRDTPYAGVAAIFGSALARGEPPQVFEDGGQMRDFVHVRDVARATVAAVDRVGALRPRELRAYNIASGTPHTVLQMAQAMADAYGGPAATDHRRVPSRRRPAHRGVAGPGPRGARLRRARVVRMQGSPSSCRSGCRHRQPYGEAAAVAWR